MTLHYLEFDYSEDDEGTGTWDAIASVAPPHVAPLQAEIARLLQWAHAEFGGRRGPIEEGGAWDYDLHSEPEGAPLQPLHFDPATGGLQPPLAPQPGARHTLTLSLCGTAEFGAALRGAFGIG